MEDMDVMLRHLFILFYFLSKTEFGKFFLRDV